MAGAFLFCIGWTAILSVTSTRLLPRYDFVGWQNYSRLFEDPRFLHSFANLAVFGVLLVGGAMLLGVFLAIGVDRAGAGLQPLLRLVFLYPLSLSWLVTGLVWQWILNPGLGLERQVRALGWTGFRFDALVREPTALYVVAGAGVWHMAGLVMALTLAGLRGVDPEIWGATRVEGIPVWRAYRHVVLPILRPQLITAVLLLTFAVARTFDLVVAMTSGGPGFATDMPTLLIYELMFVRSRAGGAAAAAILLMLTMLVVLAPYLALRRRA